MPRREYANIECVVCHETKPRAARGMCRACYARWQKTGTVEYRRQPKVCTVEGCERKTHADGLCSMHWQRLRRTGEIGGAAPNKLTPTGQSSHELYPTWENAKRRDLDPVWAEFPVFVLAVGERPSRRHRLVRRDLTKPLGPLNFEWREPVISKEPGETLTDFNARYKRATREQYGHAHREHRLVSKYGLTLPQLTVMAEAQDRKCAICGEHETEMRNGLVRHLAVDHDHKTGKVRALLCQPCNKGLGHFKDDIGLLLKAAAYLRKHEQEPLAPPPTKA